MPDANPVALPPTPSSIQVIVWAVVASLVGFPVNIQLNGISGYLRTLISRRIIDWVGQTFCHIIQCKKDIKILLTRLDSVRIAVFTDVRLYSQTEWLVENTFDINDRNKRLGPVLLLLDSELPDDPAGPLLGVHCAPHELKNLGDWLKGSAELPIIPKIDPNSVVSFDPRNDVHQGWLDTTQYGVDLRIVQSLLIGASLSHANLPGGHTESIRRETYTRVKETLKSSLFQPPGCGYSPRLTFMVTRGNNYLKMKGEEGNKPGSKEDQSDVLQMDGLLTLREMVDLGNIKGKTARNLVEFLMKDQLHGFQKFIDCGLTVKLRGDIWPSEDPEDCSKLLMPWSPKQVRTEFSRACDSKYLTVTQTAGNKPYIYRLPESFTKPLSSFRNLPEPEALVFPLGTIESPAPASPSPAQGSGQSEIVAE